MTLRPPALWSSVGRPVLQGVIDLIYPPVCLLCNDLLSAATDFCESCRDALTEDHHAACPRCAATVGAYTNLEKGCPSCREHGFHFHQAVRLGAYEERLREAILRMKHAAGEDLAHALGRAWAERARPRFQELGADVVVPVPLHWARRFQRGYNQAETLAYALAGKLGIPCRPRRLCRIRHTPHQTGQSVTARRENVHGAFHAWPSADLQKKTILLVDDVMTTGNTCSEAARALKNAGAARIIAAVLARSG